MRRSQLLAAAKNPARFGRFATEAGQVSKFPTKVSQPGRVVPGQVILRCSLGGCCASDLSMQIGLPSHFRDLFREARKSGTWHAVRCQLPHSAGLSVADLMPNAPLALPDAATGSAPMP